MRLYVGFLYFNIIEEMFRGIFELFGKVIYINLLRIKFGKIWIVLIIKIKLI